MKMNDPSGKPYRHNEEQSEAAKADLMRQRPLVQRVNDLLLAKNAIGISAVEICRIVADPEECAVLRSALERALKFFSAGNDKAAFDPTDPEERAIARAIQTTLDDMKAALRYNAPTERQKGEAV